jgi:hypothetical protein
VKQQLPKLTLGVRQFLVNSLKLLFRYTILCQIFFMTGEQINRVKWSYLSVMVWSQGCWNYGCSFKRLLVTKIPDMIYRSFNYKA